MICSLEIKRTVSAYFALAVIAVGIGCAPENPRLMTPPRTYSDAFVETKLQQILVQPKVDILFVMDDSGSMIPKQKTLGENIDKFAMAIAKDSGIDFHVGVTAIWDTRIYAVQKREYGHGEFRRLKDPNGHFLPESFGRFVSSKDDYDSYLTKQGVDISKKPGWVQVIAATVKIGIDPYNPNWQKDHKGGPDNEEVFSPVKAALEDPMKSGPNKNFRRDDAQLVVMFVTDTDAYMKDSHTGERFDLTSDQLVEFLKKHVQTDNLETLQKKVTVIGALARDGDPDAEKDPSIRRNLGGLGRPENILRFIGDMGGRWMGLLDKDYGIKMASLGELVRQKSLQKPRVSLNAVPEKGTEKVTVNGVDLIHGDAGWVYDNELPNTFVINEDLSKLVGPIDIKVKFTAVDSQAINSGRAKSSTK